jgi:UDP-N-acetylmuramoyl-L-alanyl-D-glutamate--2,6-diaminopimelate ligase
LPTPAPSFPSSSPPLPSPPALAIPPSTLAAYLAAFPELRLEPHDVGSAADALAITRVIADSRAAGPGALFVAVAGETSDGHAFAVRAALAGAPAVVLEIGHAGADQVAAQARAHGAAVLWHPQTRRALAVLAATSYGRPADRLRMVGVTGTNGKTTTTYLVEEILRSAGRRPAVVGTVKHRFAPTGEPARTWPAAHTTPDPLTLHALFAELCALGATDVVMEVSSHALQQERVAGLSYAAAGFSNLTRDHLDFHGSMEAYYAAKRRLFTELSRGPSVVNVDDPAGATLAAELRAAGRPVRRVTTRAAAAGDAEVAVLSAQMTAQGTSARLRTPAGELALCSPLVGDFNLANLALATGIGLALEVPLAAIAAALATCQGAPGRLERVTATGGSDPRGVLTLVDYAHTPDALERALEAVRPLVAPGGRLICVMGCGGERDPGKRPLMGEVAARGADLVVVTSDNPRREDPVRIVEDILPGVRRGGLPEAPSGAALAAAGRGFVAVVDRRAGIAAAVAAGRPGDVLLVAGKGHEDYQIIGTEKRPFDDRQVAREAAAALDAASDLAAGTRPGSALAGGGVS